MSLKEVVLAVALFVLTTGLLLGAIMVVAQVDR